jgi:hypothetical protein
MKQVQVTTRSQWRRWLAENHDQETDGIWLIFTRKETGRPSLEKEESVEEAAGGRSSVASDLPTT